MAFEKAQCFPFYVYEADEIGFRRKENITDWALQQFRDAQGPDVTKWHIFYYVYALLHSPAYRTRYAENLKRELPRIPPNPPAPFPDSLLRRREGGEQSPATPAETAPPQNSPFPVSAANESGKGAGGLGSFFHYAAIGERLAILHRDYETAAEYRLQSLEDRSEAYSWRVEKMKLSKDKTQIVVNPSLTLAGVPLGVYEYRLGNRSALEWVLDQYQVTTDKRSGLVSDPNRADAKEYIVSLLGKVITVSLETVRLVRELEADA